MRMSGRGEGEGRSIEREGEGRNSVILNLVHLGVHGSGGPQGVQRKIVV
jgi:hypothetical protein